MATTLYFPPAYFSPYYFAPLGVPTPTITPVGPLPPVGTTPYFPPTYFSPFYFTPLVASAAPPTYRDRDAYEAILALLRATGAFEAVLFACPIDRLALGSSATPLATLIPEGWEEFDEVDPTAILRRVTFSLDILVRDDDPLARFEGLVLLESAAHDAIEGSDLGGGCLPELTRLRRGRYDQRSLHPEQSVRLDGEFTYMVGTTVLPLSTT